jgi:major membrane immunogen (membrane-anchored lipoprotein)
MKTIKIPMMFAIILVLVASSSFYSRTNSISHRIKIQDTVIKYSDGVYEGQSQHIYKDEPYWGKVQIKIENGRFSLVRFIIRDSSLHETFNQFYEKHFEKIPEYVEQCRNDWKGVQTYPEKLLKSQNINKVDAMSGATWSYNIFKASADSALKRAVKK